MTKQTLVSNRVDQVDNVIHIADVHIRNFTRHSEYETVFQRLYEYCQSVVDVNKNTVIYLAGDIVHTKTDMSPELIVTTRNLFVNLGKIAPVILIAGNHDMNLNNRNRLDALSPIVESIEIPDFFYLKETGVYHFGGVDFVLNAVWEEPENFIKASDVNTNNIKVALYHGALDKSYLDGGMHIKNNRLSVSTFEGFDFGMFGDIHAFQYLDDTARFAYAGSLIQQSYGEGIRHGVINWDLRARKSKFIPIKNDWGYYTIDIENGRIKNMPTEFSDRNRIRFRSYDNSSSELSKIITSVKTKIRVEETKIQKISTKQSSGQYSPMVKTGDIREIEQQNSLLSSYLQNKYHLGDTLLEEILKVNRLINNGLDKTPVSRNTVWSPVRFEFSNMFSYGEDNYIDFSQMNGSYGIFASNASGKSSILDAIMFCIFDTCSRTYKASQVMNNKKDWFTCKLHFQINGRNFFIERTGKRDKKTYSKVSATVNFWYEDYGERVSLNGTSVNDTNLAIRNYLGTYNDFIITAMSLQGNNTNFIDKTQKDRKDLLAQFLDLDVFDELHEAAAVESKSLQTLIKEYSKYDYSSQINDSKRILEKSKLDMKVLMEEKESLKDRVDGANTNIVNLTKQLRPVDSRLTAYSIDEIKARKSELESSIVSCRQSVLDSQENTRRQLGEVTALEAEYAAIDGNKLNSDWRLFDELRGSIAKMKDLLEKIEIQITHNTSKIDNLTSHEYDPDCQYCVNNVFVKDAKQAEAYLLELNAKKDLVLAELESSTEKLKSVSYADEAKQRYTDLERKILSQKMRLHEYEKEEISVKSRCDEMDGKIEKLNELIETYYANEEMIKENAKIQTEINLIKSDIERWSFSLDETEKEYVNLIGEIRVHEKTIADSVASIKHLEELETQYKAYEMYLKAVHRDGIPYKLISEAIPKVQSEVNSILSQVVDFQVIFETDGKSINTYIAYDDENFWPLEMTSGMEKFVSSLAIRTALINVSSLPRANFIAIDEGFGVLDSDNLTAIHTFFDYLKTQFDFILTISHIDTMRDIMDSSINIHKENGVSSVQF